MSADAVADLVLRPAGTDDLPAVADIYLRSREAAAMPPGIHPPDEVRAWVSGWDLTGRDVWLAEGPEGPLGFINLTPTFLEGLYVVPEAARKGVGSALLGLAKAQRSHGFGLWVFEMNHPARAFYRRHGLVELERTDGSGNEEKTPDVKMVWPGTDPLACFRAMIDEVDDQLGDLLARRTALTRVIQDHKRAVAAVDDPGRDAAREAEIVQRVAALAPELGEDRVARIVQTIITESLDAARRAR